MPKMKEAAETQAGQNSRMSARMKEIAGPDPMGILSRSHVQGKWIAPMKPPITKATGSNNRTFIFLILKQNVILSLHGGEPC